MAPGAPDEGCACGAGTTVGDSARSLTPTDSPCVARCSTLYDDVCRGCGRTVLEVANWVFLDDAEKAEVWVRIRSQGFPKKY
ncbi:DUF1289 domain-containing protein [Alcaligenaceae bacterium CGII-47]|nr:DUF1289 domain-containing protein [Alcaligenaceae bacterium CGII-47]